MAAAETLLRLLLDEHLSLAVARQLRARGIDVVTLAEWQGGRYRSQPDDAILRAAYEDRRAMVTYDLSSIPATIRSFYESGTQHAGVIYISSKTIRSDETGALIRALERFAAAHPGGIFNQEHFLRRVER